MTIATPEYASAFRELEREIGDRVATVVCAIPGAVPRMLARTVAMFSKKKWRVHKTVSEAIDFLLSQGVAAADVKVALAAESRVTIV